MRRTRILIADDHALLREGLAELISLQPDLEVVGQASDGESTLSQLRACAPDVITLDLSMPGSHGFRLIETVAREFPRTRIVVLTMHDDSAYKRAALAAGAACYVVKSRADEDLVKAMRDEPRDASL